jgi:glycosyltransferase involved in cell wall biosynthesis
MDPSSGAPPAFTVVVPVYEGAAAVGGAVRSVLAQTLTDLELVVVDDGSTDRSGDAALAAGAGDPRLRVVRQPNRGRSAARNRGAAEGRGRYVVFLDADDHARSGWLEGLWAVSAGGTADLLHCAQERVPDTPGAAKISHPKRYGPLFAYQMGPFLPGTFAVRADRFAEVGGFAEDLVFGENYEIGLRLCHAAAAGGWTTGALDEPLVVHHVRADQSTYDRERYETAKVMLTRHRDKLGVRRAAVSAQYAIVGVNAHRLGRRREAAWALLHAIAADPTRGRNYSRLLRVTVPGRPRRRTA